MSAAIRTLQSRLAALGFDPLGIDGIPGYNTAKALVAAWRAGAVPRFDPIVDAALAEVAAATPNQRDLPALTGLAPDLYADDPSRPGGCVWTERGRGWESRNLIPVLVPGYSKPLRLHRRAAFAIVVGFGECVVFEGMPEARMESFCLRHMNWDSAQPLTTHGYGVSVDRDWDCDGKMERIEGNLARYAPCLARVGLVMGDHWKDRPKKKVRDAMHVQAARV